MFNAAFQRAMSGLQEAGVLEAARVVIGGDVIPRLPPSALGGSHAVRGRFLLTPEREDSPVSYSDRDADDAEAWKIAPADDHICHALFLSGETTRGRQTTVPLGAPWPTPDVDEDG